MIKEETTKTSWYPLEDFPEYEINYLGGIRNIASGVMVDTAKFNYTNYVELMLDGKPYLQHVNRLRWKTFNLAPYPRTSIDRHGKWIKDEMRYSDGEKSHLCGMVCSVGEV